MQADIFDVKIEKVANEQGLGMGAAMLPAGFLILSIR